MPKYEATFDIGSESDAYAARRIVEQVYDTVREESYSVSEGSDERENFEALREAARDTTPGRLTITYEQYDDEFDD